MGAILTPPRIAKDPPGGIRFDNPERFLGGNPSWSVSGWGISGRLDLRDLPGATRGMYVSYNTITGLLLPSPCALRKIVADVTDLPEIDVSTCAVLSELEARDCALLASVVGLDKTVCISAKLDGCALPTAAVDRILSDIWDSEVEDGVYDLSGGTSGPPSTAYLSVQGDGIIPNVTGDYAYAGTHEGKPYWTKDIGGTTWYIAWDGGGGWMLTTEKGIDSDPGWFAAEMGENTLFGAPAVFLPLQGEAVGEPESGGPGGGAGTKMKLEAVRGATVTVNEV